MEIAVAIKQAFVNGSSVSDPVKGFGGRCGLRGETSTTSHASDGCELYLNRDELLGMIISTLEQMCSKERRYRFESQPESVAFWWACFAFFLEVSNVIRSESHPQMNSLTD